MTKFFQTLEIAVALPVEGTFTYGVSKRLAEDVLPGKRVLVPFGNRRVTGFVLGPGTSVKEKVLKPVIEVMDEAPIFSESMIPFFRWISEYYLHPLGEAIRTGLPGGVTVSDRTTLAITDRGRELMAGGGLKTAARDLLQRLQHPVSLQRVVGRNAPAENQALVRELEAGGFIRRQTQLAGGSARHLKERIVALAGAPAPRATLSESRKKIIAVLASQGPMPIRRLKEHVPTAPALIRAMEKDGQVRIHWQTVYRDPFGEPIPPDSPPALTGAQRAAVDTIAARLPNGYAAFLLTGVTGSGKTEVYLHAAGAALDMGKGTLVLVPEIALITEMERRFRARFGTHIAVLHSALTAGERFDQWMRVVRGEAKVVIGARSALFAPLASLGLVVVDEEHDPSFKQETGLRYNARDMALVRAKLAGAVAVLGSATPSVQSVHNAQTGKFVEIQLPERIESRPMPAIEVVDLTAFRDLRGPQRYLTEPLRQAMAEALQRDEQVLLFLNRRGYSSFPVCGACGSPVTCRHCDIAMTFHQGQNVYRCHYCGYQRPAQSVCDACGAEAIRLLGLGTEKLEETVKGLFPEARVARMDRDTTGRKGAILKLLRALRRREIDVLIGTQMVAKGHDFPNITLVGIVSADLSMNFPDFRAGERTFQLLAQVAGRAGRGDRPGRVIMQTYNPDHFCITTARDQDFRNFFTREIQFRRKLGYPPFARLLQLRFSGREKNTVSQNARQVGDRLRAAAGMLHSEVEVLGPIESPLSKIAGRFRWQLLVKGPGAAVLRQLVRRVLLAEDAPSDRRVSVSVDVDPVSML